MYCTRCGKHISECTCPDIDERLASVAGPESNVVYKICRKCGKHYDRCRCKDPEWGLSTELKSGEGT